MNRSAKRKIANKLLPNRWNKLRTGHYFIDGVGGGGGWENWAVNPAPGEQNLLQKNRERGAINA